ncbi:hypothetical protein C9374_000414 [Naegleria lovaniensis]|uniref:Uncharacterized protein n=1 Tax=Naegleria lovaniensis TaxID=51637 RepID=A0AA88GSV0_NAELO|nr:uncharacterized protein C9374_000414 [Naegleria lovaniensis]KAG2388250.1 hypothetical protein C9374_000414 [Naegleria lovaniensis]
MSTLLWVPTTTNPTKSSHCASHSTTSIAPLVVADHQDIDCILSETSTTCSSTTLIPIITKNDHNLNNHIVNNNKHDDSSFPELSSHSLVHSLLAFPSVASFTMNPKDETSIGNTVLSSSNKRMMAVTVSTTPGELSQSMIEKQNEGTTSCQSPAITPKSTNLSSLLNVGLTNPLEGMFGDHEDDLFFSTIDLDSISPESIMNNHTTTVPSALPIAHHEVSAQDQLALTQYLESALLSQHPPSMQLGLSANNNNHLIHESNQHLLRGDSTLLNFNNNNNLMMMMTSPSMGGFMMNQPSSSNLTSRSASHMFTAAAGLSAQLQQMYPTNMQQQAPMANRSSLLSESPSGSMSNQSQSIQPQTQQQNPLMTMLSSLSREQHVVHVLNSLLLSNNNSTPTNSQPQQQSTIMNTSNPSSSLITKPQVVSSAPSSSPLSTSLHPPTPQEIHSVCADIDEALKDCTSSLGLIWSNSNSKQQIKLRNALVVTTTTPTTFSSSSSSSSVMSSPCSSPQIHSPLLVATGFMNRSIGGASSNSPLATSINTTMTCSATTVQTSPQSLGAMETQNTETSSVTPAAKSKTKRQKKEGVKRKNNAHHAHDPAADQHEEDDANTSNKKKKKTSTKRNTKKGNTASSSASSSTTTTTTTTTTISPLASGAAEYVSFSMPMIQENIMMTTTTSNANLPPPPPNTTDRRRKYRVRFGPNMFDEINCKSSATSSRKYYRIEKKE